MSVIQTFIFYCLNFSIVSHLWSAILETPIKFECVCNLDFYVLFVWTFLLYSTYGVQFKRHPSNLNGSAIQTFMFYYVNFSIIYLWSAILETRIKFECVWNLDFYVLLSELFYYIAPMECKFRNIHQIWMCLQFRLSCFIVWAFLL